MASNLFSKLFARVLDASEASLALLPEVNLEPNITEVNTVALQGEPECSSLPSNEKAVRLGPSNSSSEVGPVSDVEARESPSRTDLQDSQREVEYSPFHKHPKESAPLKADARSSEPETCSICLDHLCGRPLGVCLGANGNRVCQHYFHLDCLRRVEGARCPHCRVRFHKRAALPSILDEPVEWCSHVSSESKRELSRREVAAALKAMLWLPPEDVDALVESYWYDWTAGQEPFCVEHAAQLTTTITPHMPCTMPNGRAPPRNAPDQDSTKLDDGHSRSGIVCGCGRIHVRRGDRIRHGPVLSDVDQADIAAGQLGTIVRIGEGQESVVVKWDRSSEAKVHTYTWPDPDGLVLAPAGFGEIAEDVLQLQNSSDLSSVACEELLHRIRPDQNALDLFMKYNGEICEESLRKPPELYHRVRILPDKFLIQQWFDSIPPCECNNPRCSGGVQWSSHAEKHLGREALVLKMDSDDDTILVETRGPCKCQIWYPRLALERVYDPDLEDKLLFDVQDRVECKMERGWEKGVVIRVLWHGEQRDGPCPYAVKLDNGSDILVPDVLLIRKA